MYEDFTVIVESCGRSDFIQFDNYIPEVGLQYTIQIKSILNLLDVSVYLKLID